MLEAGHCPTLHFQLTSFKIRVFEIVGLGFGNFNETSYMRIREKGTFTYQAGDVSFIHNGII